MNCSSTMNRASVPNRVKLYVSQTLVICFAAALCACSTVKDFVMPSGVKLDWESVSLSVAAGANNDYPLAIDLVLVTDEALAQKLMGMTAREWFNARHAMRKAYPDAISMDSVELAPGESIKLSDKRWSGRRVAAALVFADYLVAGPHLARVDALRGRVQLDFGATEFTAYSLEK